jgi:opacity protein-like surface antigen
MKKSVCVLAVLAATVSTSAVAKDLKQEKKAPAISATQMTDSEMDRVTAGFRFFNGKGELVENPSQGKHLGLDKGGGARPFLM